MPQRDGPRRRRGRREEQMDGKLANCRAKPCPLFLSSWGLPAISHALPRWETHLTHSDLMGSPVPMKDSLFCFHKALNIAHVPLEQCFPYHLEFSALKAGRNKIEQDCKRQMKERRWMVLLCFARQTWWRGSKEETAVVGKVHTLNLHP